MNGVVVVEVRSRCAGRDSLSIEVEQFSALTGVRCGKSMVSPHAIPVNHFFN